MKKLLLLGALLLPAAMVSAQSCPDYLNVTMKKLHSSEQVNLCELAQDNPVLIVNTASNCGFTPHFKSLEALHKEYKDQGLVVIGFPSNDFYQEEAAEKNTAKVCYVNYGVTFTMLAPSAVRGDDANSVFKFLGDKSSTPKWNFYKYLIDGKGKNVTSFSPKTSPDDADFVNALENLVNNQSKGS
ncbi:MAG: glutathione peroxidase [Thalassotalea sp.]